VEKNCQYCPYQSICSREASQGYSSWKNLFLFLCHLAVPG
jgi:ATP-dependent helicase/DNAse subunit B